MRRGDFILFGVLAIVIITLTSSFIMNSIEARKYTGKTYAKIELDGKLYKKVELTETSQDLMIVTERGYDLLRISDRGIHVVESDCPEKICMSYGHIRRVREMIVCLPLRMVIEVVGESYDVPELDALVS
jgi:hypothetical protein